MAYDLQLPSYTEFVYIRQVGKGIATTMAGIGVGKYWRGGFPRQRRGAVHCHRPLPYGEFCQRWSSVLRGPCSIIFPNELIAQIIGRYSAVKTIYLLLLFTETSPAGMHKRGGQQKRGLPTLGWRAMLS